MRNKKHLYHLSKRMLCMSLAAMMVLSTALTGCGSKDITSHALEDEMTDIVSVREVLSSNLDNELAEQAAAISDKFWENDVPANEQAAVYEYAFNEGILAITDNEGNITEYTSNYEIGASVGIDSVNATTVEKKYDENGLRETVHEVKVMYTTVDQDYLTASDITDMWNDNYEAFISNIRLQQRLYEVDGYDDCYVAFLNYSELNGTNGKIIDADFTRGTEQHPVDMTDQVVFDYGTGILYVPKAWYFAGDGTEISLDLCAQVMVSVDIHDENMTDEYGNLLVSIPVTVENKAKADTILKTGRHTTFAYDFAILPLFNAGSVSGVSMDDVKVYVNGAAEPLSIDDLSYNPATGELTIKRFAMSVSEVKIVFPEKTFLQSMASIFSIGSAKADDMLTNIYSGMTPIYNVTTGEECMPNIDLTLLSVGDVLAYATIGNYGSRYTEVYKHMWNNGCSNFVYTSGFGGDLSRSDTYWMFVGNQDLTTNLDYTLGKKDNYGFIIELPFSDDTKAFPHPILVKTSGNKTNPGTPIRFGSKEDWKWTDEVFDANDFWGDDDDDHVGDPRDVAYNYSVPGQCSHTEDSTYASGNVAASPTSGFACTHSVGTFSCSCNDAGCIAYRNSKPGVVKPTTCDSGCPTCRGGSCTSCANTCEQFRISSGLSYCTSACRECSYGRCSSCSELVFRCSCRDIACLNYRTTTGLSFCDMNCPCCSAGNCDGCSTKWMNESTPFAAQASVRILMMTDGYMLIGLAQLDSGDCQRGTSVIKVRTSVKVGVKKNSNSTINDGVTGNSCYGDLSDSEYTIYADEALTQPLGTVRGDGVDYILIPVGTYYIKETLAPRGYYMDTEIHCENINQNTVLEYYDVPMDDPMTITAQKNVENRNTAGITAGDVGDLSGIQFDVYYYKDEYSSLAELSNIAADEHAVFQTDERGILRLDNKYLVPGQVWKYQKGTGRLTFPLGTVVVKEKSAIDGMLISNNSGMMFTLTDKSDKTSNAVTIDNYFGTMQTVAGSSNVTVTADRVGGSYENAVAKGGVTVWKADLDWEESNYQGDATLAGAEFTIYNRSDSSVYYNGTIYDVDKAIGTITTVYDSSANAYVATTGARALEYGTYEIVETKAPTGYNKADWSRTFTIRDDGQMHNYKQSSNTDLINGLNWTHRWCADGVIRGGVAFGKVDRETKQYINSGTSSLAGARFQIINKSDHTVYVNGRNYAKDAVIMELTAAEMTIDGKKVVGNTTGNYVLPYGTYQLREISSGIGYLCDTNSKVTQTKTFSIHSDGQMVYYTDEAQAFHNQVQREDWYFQKKADDSGKEMTNTAWTVTSVTTGETHVIVTDENGMYDSEQINHTQKTNANDPDSPISNGAVGIDRDGNYYVKDSSKLDYATGTWFTGFASEKTKWASNGKSYTMNGGTNTIIEVNDEVRAYPYDTYIVQELSSDANDGYNCISFIVTLKHFNDDPDSNGILLDYGTVDNQHVDIYTKLGYDATGFGASDKSVPETGSLELTDTITYAGLTAGGEYTMKGKLHMVDKDGNDEGVIASNDVTFMAKASGQLEMTFNADTSGCAGKTLVATEEIYQDGTLLAEETDLDNENQTVWISGITATRAERTRINSDSLVTVTDHVDYVNLEIGSIYTLSMSLVDQKTGRLIQDKNGNDITAEIMFSPETNAGTQNIAVTFEQPAGFNSVTAVVFEELTKGVVYSEHKDLNDKNQTVPFADMIDTYAVNANGFTKSLSAKSGQSVYECISLRDLQSNKSYKLEGTVYWVDDDGNVEAVCNSKGDAIVKTIENPRTNEVMVFDGIDASNLGGRDIVVYQTLYERDSAFDAWRVAFEHHDSKDEDQTVHVPWIETTFTADNGVHNTEASSKVTLTDKVNYKNLIPGQKYSIIGSLHIRDDAEVQEGYEPVDTGIVKNAAGRTEFIAAEKDGTTSVTFTYDASELKGTVVVAYEELYTDASGNVPSAWSSFFRDVQPTNTGLLMTDADITNVKQSVGFANITSTELTGDEIYTKVINGVITVIETVNWDGLVPGHQYEIDEVFSDAGEDTKLQISTDGTFTPETVKGSITVSNTRDVQTEVRKDVLLAKDNMSLTDVVNYEGLIPGMTYVLTSSLMVKDEDGTLRDEPLMVMEGSFVPETINGTVYATYLFDASSLAGKTLVAFEKISINGVSVAMHEDPNDEAQTVRFPKLDTIFAGKDYDGAEGAESIKTIEFQTYSGHQDVFGVGQLQVEAVDIVDTITYTNLIPGLEYVIKGEVHLKANYNELHDFIKSDLDLGTLYADESATFIPDKPNGTIQLVFHVAPIGITAADLVAYEYLFIDDGLIGMHADITDEQQTVTIIGRNANTGLNTILSGTEAVITNNPAATVEDSDNEELVKTVEYYTYGGHMDKRITLVDTINYRGLVIGSEYTMNGEIHIKNRYGADMGIVAANRGFTFTPDTADGTLKMTFIVNPSDLDADIVDLVAFEYLYENGNLAASHASISDSSQTVTIIIKEDPITIDTELFGIKIDAPDDGETTETKSDEADGADEVDDADEELVKTVEFNVYEEVDRYGKVHTSTDTITLVDNVSYTNLTPGAEYRLEGEIHFKGRFGLDMGNMGINQTVAFIPDEPDGTVEVRFKVDPMDIRNADLVAYEYLYEGSNNKVIASHADILDENQTVNIIVREEPIVPEPSLIDTVLLGMNPSDKVTVSGNDADVSGNDTDVSVGGTGGANISANGTGIIKAVDLINIADNIKTTELTDVINFNRYVKLNGSNESTVQADTIILVDTVNYTDLEPDTEYTLKGEIHIRDIYGRDMGIISRNEVKFIPNRFEGTVKSIFYVSPNSVNITDIVAFEYLYKGDDLVTSHADIHDEDQTATIVAKGNICGCNDPGCKHKDEKDHCLYEHCCKDSDCCKNCDDCEHRNSCGCDDPKCRHKNEKDHCIDNPGCCDDSGCCKKCKQCKSNLNACGCDDPDCKHKNEKNHCTKTGCCDDTDCCKDCKQCKSVATSTKKPANHVIEVIKTGQETFLLACIIVLAVVAAVSGGGYFFFTQTVNGRKLLKKLCLKLGKLIAKK